MQVVTIRCGYVICENTSYSTDVKPPQVVVFLHSKLSLVKVAKNNTYQTKYPTILFM